MFTLHIENPDIARLTNIVYTEVQQMLAKDPINPINLAIALTCASNMILNEFAPPEEVLNFKEYANNLLIDYNNITKH
jgi:hypothetical protein|tara:strand:- start:23 stop:256 length:234 start_codon:yes stop_codon:yes gene_type:complete